MNKDTLLGGNVQRKFLNNEKISKLTQGKENNHKQNNKKAVDLSLKKSCSNEKEINVNKNYNSKNDSKSNINTEPIIFKVSIKLDQGEGKISVRGGDSLFSLAQKFAITHKLDRMKTNKV